MKKHMGNGLEPVAFDLFGAHAWQKFQSWLEKEGREFFPYCHQQVTQGDSYHCGNIQCSVLCNNANEYELYHLIRPLLKLYFCDPATPFFCNRFNAHFLVKHSTFSISRSNIFQMVELWVYFKRECDILFPLIACVMGCPSCFPPSQNDEKK